MALPLLAFKVFWAYIKRFIGGIPVWAVALAVLIGLGYWWGERARSQGHAAGAAEVQAKFDKATIEWERQKLHAALASKQAEADARAEEKRTATAQLEIIRDAHTATVQRLQTDVAAGRATSDRLRERVDTLVAAARQAPRDTAAAGGSPPADDAINLLAELQRRADARAGELALIADERGITGEACERAYDSLTSTLMALAVGGFQLGETGATGGFSARGGGAPSSSKGTHIRATEFPGVVLRPPATAPPFNAGGSP